MAIAWVGRRRPLVSQPREGQRRRTGGKCRREERHHTGAGGPRRAAASDQGHAHAVPPDQPQPRRCLRHGHGNLLQGRRPGEEGRPARQDPQRPLPERLQRDRRPPRRRRSTGWRSCGPDRSARSRRIRPRRNWMRPRPPVRADQEVNRLNAQKGTGVVVAARPWRRPSADLKAAAARVDQTGDGLHHADGRATQGERSRPPRPIWPGRGPLPEAERLLGTARSIAPIDGTILTKVADRGVLVSPMSFNVAAGICSMADLSDLEAEIDVREDQITLIRPGLSARSRPSPTRTRCTAAAWTASCRSPTTRRTSSRCA